MADDVSLSSATRDNLLTLQRTTRLIGQTQERLATGKKVNSAIDDALSFFKARSFNNRASDLATLKNGILEGIKVLETATQALESVESILQQMKAVAESAKATAASDSASRVTLANQYNELRTQLDNLTDDASYNGVNLVQDNADDVTIKFSEQDSTRALTVTGTASDSSALGVNQAAADATGWAASAGYVATIDSAIAEIDSALTTVRDTAQQFGTNASLLEIRRDFTDNLISTLRSGAGELVNADLNEESANLLSLQTRQQLGTISLSIAQQSEQSVLRLF